MNKDSKILVTGAKGFLGQSVCENLYSNGYTNLVRLGGHKEMDLTRQSMVNSLMLMHRPDAVLHLAARVGGIGANAANPGRYMYDNLSMGTNLIHASYKIHTVKKFVMVGTVCAYPKFTTVPFNDIWNGYPEETNAPYGIAKRALVQLLMSYKAQYGLNSTNLIPVNLYGPHDNFNPESSHVIPALILKVARAMKDGTDLQVWGTGSASREFLYVEDAADAIRLALETDTDSTPINIGTGCEIQIKELVALICDYMGFQGKIQFDSSKPDGQPRRCLDTSKARKQLGFTALTPFHRGLRNTIAWFNNSGEIDKWN